MMLFIKTCYSFNGPCVYISEFEGQFSLMHSVNEMVLVDEFIQAVFPTVDKYQFHEQTNIMRCIKIY